MGGRSRLANFHNRLRRRNNSSESRRSSIYNDDMTIKDETFRFDQSMKDYELALNHREARWKAQEKIKE